MPRVRPLPVFRRAPRGREDACGGGVHASALRVLTLAVSCGGPPVRVGARCRV